MHIDKQILDKANEWLTPTFDSKTKEEIEKMMTSSPKELEDSFYKNLEFTCGNTFPETEEAIRTYLSSTR